MGSMGREDNCKEELFLKCNFFSSSEELLTGVNFGEGSGSRTGVICVMLGGERSREEEEGR